MPKNEFDFDDPMELNGVGLASEEDTTGAMTECFIEEFMRLGYNARQILALFRNPHYLGMNLVVQNRGEQFVRDRIGEIFLRWGKPVAWPGTAPQPFTPTLSPSDGERQNCQQSVGASSAVENSRARSLLSPLPAAAGRGEGELGSQACPEFQREQLIEHDATATDPTGASIPILNP